MTEAFKCDRCGEFEEGKASFTIWEGDGDMQRRVGQELCDKCTDVFDDFLQGKVHDADKLRRKERFLERLNDNE